MTNFRTNRRRQPSNRLLRSAVPIHNNSNSNSSNNNSNTRRRTRIDDPTEKCCFRLTHITVSIIHFLEFTFSLILIGYSLAISLRKPDPQHAIATLLQSWSVLLLITSISGTIGLAKEYCNRILLKISSWIGLVKAFVCVIFSIVIMIQKEALHHYFEEKHDQLFISMEIVEFLYNNVNLVYGLLILLALADFIRFSFLRSLREDLLLYDEAKSLGLILEQNNDNDATTPLLMSTSSLPGSDDTNWWSQNNEKNDDDDDDMNNNNQERNDGQWWEDGIREKTDEEDYLLMQEQQQQQQLNEDYNESITSISHQDDEQKSWMSRLSSRWTPSKSSQPLTSPSPRGDHDGIRNNNNLSSETDTSIHHEQSICSNDLFSPIDEDIEFQGTTSTTYGSNVDGNYASSSAWCEEDDTTNIATTKPEYSNSNPDLSWTKGDNEDL